MAAFTQKAAGNWSSAGQTTWNEVGVPGNGDTIIASIGNLIVNVNTTVGHSPGTSDPTMAILINTPATLTIATGVTLVCRGDMQLNNTTVTLNAGAILEFDASQAGVPATATYFCRLGTAHNQTNVKLIANGTAGTRCTIRSNAGGANARLTSSGFLSGGSMDCTYTDFLRLGTASGYAFAPSLGGAASDIFSLQHCVADTCGKIDVQANALATATLRLSGLTYKNTLGSIAATLLTSAALTTGVRSVVDCVFDKDVQFFSCRDYTIENTVFSGLYEFTDALGGWASFTNNFVRDAVSNSVPTAGNTTNCYALQHHDLGNPHFIQPTINRSHTIDGWVFEYTGSAGDGDCVLIPSPASPMIYTLKNILVLPNGNNQTSGTIFTQLGNANVTLSCEHCTAFVGTGGGGGGAVGETYAGHAGMLSSFKSNLVWSNAASVGFKLYDSGVDDAVTDLVSSANGDYNGGWNLAAGSNLKGYDHLEFSSGAPGAHDVNGNPGFVDSARNLAKWDLSLGGPGTVANALAELAKCNDAAGYNSNYTIAGLLAYVKAGFVPTNLAFKAAHDAVSPSNGWMGAVEGSGTPVYERLGGR